MVSIRKQRSESIILFVLMLSYGIFNASGSKIHIFGAKHGPMQDKYMMLSWQKYKKGEVEFLCEGIIPEWNNPNDVHKCLPFILELYWQSVATDIMRAKLIYNISACQNVVEYWDKVQDFEAWQNSFDNRNIIIFSQDWISGSKKAQKIFPEYWKIFTHTAADNFPFLAHWKKVSYDDNTEGTNKQLELFFALVHQFRNINMATKIAHKFKNSTKPIHVHIGEAHRKGVVKALIDVYDIPEEKIHDKFLEKTKI